MGEAATGRRWGYGHGKENAFDFGSQVAIMGIRTSPLHPVGADGGKGRRHISKKNSQSMAKRLKKSWWESFSFLV